MTNVSFSDESDKIISALVAAQAEIGPALADKENTFHESKYADLASVVEAVRQPFAANGLGFMQFPSTRQATVDRSYREPVEVQVGRYAKKLNRPVYHAEKALDDEGREYEIQRPTMETVPVIYVSVRTRIIHDSGQWIESDLEIPVVMDDNPAQAIGKTTTYARRYSLMALTGVAPDDDDAQGLYEGGQPEYQTTGYQMDQRQPAAAPRHQPQAPQKPQGAEARFEFLCGRMRSAKNITTLRAFYDSGKDELIKKKASPEMLAELAAVKDQIKAKFDEHRGEGTSDVHHELKHYDTEPADVQPRQAKTTQSQDGEWGF